MTMRFAVPAITALLVALPATDAVAGKRGFVSSIAASAAKSYGKSSVRSQSETAPDASSQTHATALAPSGTAPRPETVTDIRSKGSSRVVPVTAYGSRTAARASETSDIPDASKLGCVAGCY